MAADNQTVWHFVDHDREDAHQLLRFGSEAVRADQEHREIGIIDQVDPKPIRRFGQACCAQIVAWLDCC